MKFRCNRFLVTEIVKTFYDIIRVPDVEKFKSIFHFFYFCVSITFQNSLNDISSFVISG